MKSDSQEIEVALIIQSENSQLIIRQIAALTSVVNYQLLSQDSQFIHDQYYDTHDKVLEKQRLALRLREIGNQRLITLKGHLKRTDWGGVERLEIEAPWSEDAIIKIMKVLQDKKIKIQQTSYSFDFDRPRNVLFNLGLVLIQDRMTHRTIRNIVRKNKNKNIVLAEFAIDAVSYNINGQEIKLNEIEIEAKTNNGVTAIKEVIEYLKTNYGYAVKEWAHSKLSTGKAIEKLFNNQVIEGGLDTNNNLTSFAYKQIEDYLRSINSY